ncbi:MAG: hypothetical protein ABI747_03645 [Candidatus Moraniibacteriota bacterium]
MLGPCKVSEIRQLTVVVRHGHSKKRAVSLLTTAYEQCREWQALVKEYAWNEEGNIVLFILVRDGQRCSGSVRIGTGHVVYQLNELPFRYLPAKSFIEAEVERQLEKILKER